MDDKELWRLNHSGEPVVVGHGDTRIVGRVGSWEGGQACISGVNAQGKWASDWYDANTIRHADDAEAEMYEAWRGLELYRDIFPHACAWIDPNVFTADEDDDANH